MQSDQIETFLDLCDSRSFNRTAERLGITQSTVSARIAALETSLDARLFNRSRAGTDLTVEGHRFAPHARTLRHQWNEARRHVRVPGRAGAGLRIGIQNDLAARYIGTWIADFRRALPDTAFYIEADYSAQMCADLLTGLQDFAVLFTPKAHPDLHFSPLGEVSYRMISRTARARAAVDPDSYILADFSPAFEAMHRDLLPEFTAAPVSVGQSTTVAALLQTLGGAGYVLDAAAQPLLSTGGLHLVEDAPVLRQPVFAATHLRHRTAPVHRRLTRIVQRTLTPR